MGVEGINCAVTGGSGLTGQRLVEMLVERGASRVVSFDIARKPQDAMEHPAIEYMQGDLTKQEDVDKACEGAHCVWHVAALVGPFHAKEAYMAVNYGGTLNVLNACRKYGVGKLIMSTSPSTRFDGNDIDGLKEDELTIPKKFLQLYAESKAMGETAVLKACSDSLLTVAIAPHQIYGPRDNLFLPGILEPMGNGQLRIFGNGKNKVSFTYIDNYCHGLILGFDSLYKGSVEQFFMDLDLADLPIAVVASVIACLRHSSYDTQGSPALGKFYIVTDGGWQFFWGVVNSAGVAMGFKDLNTKVHLPALMMLAVGYICNVIGWVLGRKLRVSPFTVKMLTIHRWFDISAAERDLGYKPIVKFEEGFPKTLEWLKEDWLPKYKAKKARK